MLRGFLVCVICDSSSFHSFIFKLYTLWLLTHWTCVHPIFCAYLIIFLGLLNLDIISSTPPLECLHYLFVCNLQFKQISFLYVQTLHNDCSHIEDVHRRRRSRAEFDLVGSSERGQVALNRGQAAENLEWNVQYKYHMITHYDYNTQIGQSNSFDHS